jgi:hypothetical protein
MTHAQDLAIANMTAAVDNLETEVIRALREPQQATCREMLAELLQIAIVGIVAEDKPKPVRLFG